MKSFPKILCALVLLRLVFYTAALRANPFGYNITNNTPNGVDLTFYESNSPGNYTFETEQFLAAGASLFLTNSAIDRATNGVAVQFTNQNSFAQIGHLATLPTLTANGGTITGCNVSVIETNFYSQFTMPAYSAAVPGLGGSGNGGTNAPSLPSYLFTGASGAGYFAPVVSTVAVPQTNDVYASGAGTNQANGHYHLAGPAPALTGGYLYTNVLGGGYLCAQFGGAGNNNDGKTFYMGATTNNQSTFDTANPTNAYWYFSSISPIAYWTNGDSANGTGAGSGANPPPVVVYGTNFVAVTNQVFFSQPFFANAFSNQIIYVSKTGNDVLASNLVCSFATCHAAKAFAQSGDLIHVLPGNYQDRDLLKNGVNWQFSKGANIGWDDPQIDMNPRGIFDDYAGAVTSSICCDRIHFSIVAPISQPAFLFTNPATHIEISFSKADSVFYEPSLAADATPGFPSLPQSGTGAGFINVVDVGYLYVLFGTVGPETNAPRQILNANDLVGQYGQYVSSGPAETGIGWSGGESHFKGVSLTVTNLIQGSLPYAFVSGNNQSVETSCYFTADYVNGFAYWDDQNTLARTWMTVTFLNDTVPNIPALRYAGQAINYYTGQKVAANGNNVIDISQGGANLRLWANIQKVTQNGAGAWINISPIASSCSTRFNILEFDDASGGKMTGGINLAGGDNMFFGGVATNFETAPITVTGGKTTLQGMTLYSFGTNADVNILTSGGTNNLTLQGCILHSQAAAESIFATNLLDAWVSGTFQADIAPTNLVKMNGTTYYHAQTPL